LHGFFVLLFFFVLLVNDQYDDQVFESEEKSIDHDHELGNLFDWTLIYYLKFCMFAMIYLLFLFGLFLLEVESSESSEVSSDNDDSGKYN